MIISKVIHLLHVCSIQVMQCSVAGWSCNLVGLRVQWRVWLEVRCCCCSTSSRLRYVYSIALLLFIVTTGWSHGVHDAVCVSTLRVRCECFLRVVVWVQCAYRGCTQFDVQEFLDIASRKAWCDERERLRVASAMP